MAFQVRKCFRTFEKRAPCHCYLKPSLQKLYGNWAQIRPVRDCGVTGGRGRQTFKNAARESQLSRRVNVIASGINRLNLYLEKNRQKLL